MSGEDRASLGVALAWIVLLAFVAFLCAVSLASAQISATNLQNTLTGWDTCYIGSCQGGSPGGSGTPSSTSQTINNASPSMSGASMLLSQTTSEDTTNVLWTYKDPSTCDECLNVESDFWVYLDSNAATVRAFEYDNFVFDATDDAEFMFGMQWDQADGVWDVWNQKTGAWVATSLTTALSYTTWHHIQVFDHRVRGDTNSCSGEPCMYFDSITIDGATTMLNMSEPASAMPSGWTSAVGTQFQIGGSDSVSGSTTYSEYIDDVNFYANGTSITVPLAAGTGIKTADITRPGINIGGTAPSPFGTTNISANLLYAMNGYMAPQMWQTNSYCAGGSTTTWTDSADSDQPANFYAGATYQVLSGDDIGDTGTVTASTAGGGGNITFTLSGTLGSSCATNDIMTLRMASPASDWTGALTPAGMSGSNGYYHWFNSSNGATASFETADLSPDTAQTQALEIDAPGSDSGQLYFIQDTVGQVWINGTYVFSFRAKGTSGTPTIAAKVDRQGGTTFLSETVTPTVNSGDGGGWTNYSYTFTGTETSPTEGLEASLTATDGDVRIADVALTEQPVSGNTSGLRNAAYQQLVAMHAGTIRIGSQASWGCDIQDALSLDNATRLCGSTTWGNGVVVSPGFTLPDCLHIANAIGDDPWCILSNVFAATDGAAVTEYLAGTCDNGNQYTAMRCNQGQTTPWTTVFAAKGQKIYLELGNEMWNSANGGASNWHSDIYGTQVGNFDASARGATDWTTEILLVADGWQARGQASGGGGDWISEVMGTSSAVTNGQPDAIDGAPYLGTFVTQASSNAAIFPPMFSEEYSMGSTTIGDETYDSMQTTASWLAGNYSATKLYGYEGTTDNAQYFLTGTTSSQINGITAGVGSGIASVLQQLLMLRDSPVPIDNMYADFQGNFAAYLCTSTSGGCSQSGTTPVWGTNLFSADQDEIVERPVGYAFQVMNSAIGSNDNLLNLTLTDQPTYSQAAAQPDPTNSGTNSIYANTAVPYVDAFGFSDGDGHYSLIAFNTNVAASESITFAGAAAPTGNVTRTVFTSTNPTDNNESTSVGGTPTVPLPTSTTVTDPTGDTLPADSMVTYTWTVGTTPTAPTLSGGIEVSGGVTIQ